MTPDEVELLQQAGRVFIFNVSVMVTESILFGLYLAIFTFGIRALLKRNPWTRYTWSLFSLLTILCLITTVNLATEIAFVVDLIRGVLVNDPEMPLIDRFQVVEDVTAGLQNAGVWLGGNGGGAGGFLFIFADLRACVLWLDNRTVRVSLWTLLLTSFGSAVVSSTLQTIYFSESDSVTTSSPAGVMQMLSLALSLATNVVATMLIGYKAYYHRRIMKSTIGLRSSRGGAILLFLTESGVAFCIIQVITVANNLSNTHPSTALAYTTAIWNQLTIFAAAAYPVLILIIIDSHRSISDHTGSFVGDSGFTPDSNGVVSRLAFATRSPGDSSSGNGVGQDTVIRSRVDPAASADRSLGKSAQVQDLEKGEGLTSSAALSDQEKREA